MKRRFLMVAGLLAVMVLAGCQSSANGNETEELKRQIAELEQQVTALEQAATVEVPANTEKQETVAEAQPETSAQEAAQNTAGAAEVPAIEDLATEVNAYVEKAKNAVPDADESKKMDQFLELKKEEERLERELDWYEDDLEAQYRNGTLSQDEFRTLDREAELLEDQLDSAEDALEFTFGFDD